MGVTAAVLSGVGTVAEMRDMFTRCKIGAEITEVQCFKRNVGAGSNQHKEELVFCIVSLIKGFIKVKLVEVWID